MSRQSVPRVFSRSGTGFAALAAALLALTACGGPSGTPGAKTYTIAFISQGTSNSWAAQLDAVARPSPLKTTRHW